LPGTQRRQYPIFLRRSNGTVECPQGTLFEAASDRIDWEIGSSPNFAKKSA